MRSERVMLIGFERMADELSALVFTMRPDGVVDYVNRCCLEYFGSGDRGGVVERWMDWVHPDDIHAVLVDRDESVTSGDVFERVQRLRRHDGEYRWHTASARQVLGDDGEVVAWVGVAVDVHDRVESERALAQSEERFRRLAEVTANVVFDWDIVADRVWFSNNLVSLAGAALPSADGGISVDALLDFTHPDDKERVRTEMAGVIDSDASAWSMSFRFVRFDGTVIAIKARGAAVRDDSGRAVRLIGNLEDRSAQDRLEHQLSRAQHLDTFTAFASGLAHELNNVFAVTLGGIDELLPALEDHPDLRKLVSLSNEATQRGVSLVADLVSFAGQRQLAPAEIDVRSVLDSVARLSHQALGHSITFEIRCDDNVSAPWADPEQLETALFNLCLNASDAMPDGGRITISATNVTVNEQVVDVGGDVAPGEYVLIEVTDDGVGMTPDVLARAVEPMFTTKGRATHAGLGLSAVHGFARQSRGHLLIASEPPRGTTVSLYLPHTATHPVTDATGAPTVTSAFDVEPAPGAPRSETTSAVHVLVVDDDASVRSMVVTQFERNGYSALQAPDAAEALAILAAGAAVDVIVTDVVMPGELDGIGLARRVRVERPDVAVVLTSGHADPITHDLADELGDVHLLPKPYRFADLLAQIATLVERN